MSITRNDLPAAIEHLEQALTTPAAAGCRDWRTAVDRALATLEQTARLHARSLTPEDGKLIDVDRPRIPSPGVTRKAEQLKFELCRLMDETRVLRARLNASLPPAAPDDAATVDLSAFLRRAKNLLEDLQHYEDDEAHLIFDSVNTDIGAGD